ncbi:MAG: type VI secretion system baseplate subunit TssK [Phycisphaerales bacterium]|nr:type VI secretion system baseplate subunit TssK [Phycisphaerales bacterium]MCI0674731.1 type VI secretion system baseplate subunit TssK [Phycisphaerales bacterium]
MAIPEQIHWHEGLFLQPHHLQLMQHQLHLLHEEQRRVGWGYPYGLIEAKLSADRLENMVVGFDRLHLVMPNGVEVDVPGNADLPTLDIKHALTASSGSLMVYVGVPRWSADRANTIESDDNWRERRLYRVKKVDRPDENTGQNLQPVMVRRINARLLLENDDQTDLEVMPLLKIGYATGEKVSLPKQDPSFIPPCLVLSGSPTLRELVRDLANQVEASRSEQRIKLTSGGFSLETMRGVQFSQMLRLRTLSRYGARLASVWQVPAATPFQIYLELRELLAELSALAPDRDQYEVSKYDHDNPGVAFYELNKKIRPLLKPEGRATWLKLDFKLNGKVLAAELSEDHLSKPNEYFLAIKTGQDPRQLARLVEDKDQFKLMPLSLAGKKIYGVRLVEERHPPLELPAQIGLNYFRLSRADSDRIWDRVKSEKKLSLEWPNLEGSDFRDNVALYMTVADGS